MIQTGTTSFPVAAMTHAGMTGKNNEDAYGVTSFKLGEHDPTPVLLAVLSDGIGGHRAGEIASKLAVDCITHLLAASDGKNPVHTLPEAVKFASQEIRKEALSNAERHGMGATCVLVLIVGRRLYAATVGDSRLYLMRGGRIRQLSTDHTWIQEAIEAGLIQPEEAVGHPNAHVIRRYLGSPEPPQADLRLHLAGGESDAQALANQGQALQPGDRLLLCSDGLTDLVKDHEIMASFLQGPPETSVQSLVDLANQRGGHDNITIVTVQVPPAPAEKEKAVPLRPIFLLGFGLLGIMVVAITFLLGYLWVSGREPPPQPTATVELPAVPPAPVINTQPVIINTAQAVPPTIHPSSPVPSATQQALLSTPEAGPTLTPWPTHTMESSQTAPAP